MLLFIYWSVMLDPTIWSPNSNHGALVSLPPEQDYNPRQIIAGRKASRVGDLP
jgi:hypothetical protein